MLSIAINNLGKKFNREWIFRNLSFTIAEGQKLVILGGNGSGKSTLLQIFAGFVSPSEGRLTYQLGNQSIESDDLMKHISLASPYLQLVEEYTLMELINHLLMFKPFTKGLNTLDVIDLMELTHAKNKVVKQFSSGMKQRLKLGLAFLADTPLLLLDEPTSNLDKSAIAWYKCLVNNYTQQRTVIVCSNAIEDEYFFCTGELNVMDYKIY